MIVAKHNFIQVDLFDTEEPSKICSKCGQRKFLDQFSLGFSNQKNRKIRNPWCKSCMNEYTKRYREKNADRYVAHAKKWAEENPEKKRSNTRRSKLRHYGLTDIEYDNMCLQQNGLCAICGQKQDGKYKNLYIDHNHLTSKVRSLLCHKCNVGLGGFRDDPALLRAAADYIEHHRKLHESAI